MMNEHNDRISKLNPAGKRETAKKLGLAIIVDDLDRCPRENVMEMLKATHLLLEHPKAPMAVFLAVDPQLIISAIAESLDGVTNSVTCYCANLSGCRIFWCWYAYLLLNWEYVAS